LPRNWLNFYRSLNPLDQRKARRSPVGDRVV
jgi:hypothetical protein